MTVPSHTDDPLVIFAGNAVWIRALLRRSVRAVVARPWSTEGLTDDGASAVRSMAAASITWG